MTSAPAVSSSAQFALNIRRRGILFVVSAPSGAGKSTLMESMRPGADFVYSVSCTTRPPRAGELEGEDYYFVSRAEFLERVEAGDFIEHAEVHGNFYGTRRDVVRKNLEAGVDVLLDIDVIGARTLRLDLTLKESLADIFLMPATFEDLRHRLLKRGTETQAQIEVRLRNAAEEIEAWREYRYTIISGSIEEDMQKFRAIMRAERYLSRRMLLA